MSDQSFCNCFIAHTLLFSSVSKTHPASFWNYLSLTQACCISVAMKDGLDDEQSCHS